MELTGPKAGHVRIRLADDLVIWMTTVRPNGHPQTSPVWFLYDGGGFLIQSLPNTARLRNMETNPNVGLNLDGNGVGGDIVIVEGVATVTSRDVPARLPEAYVDKYAARIASYGWTPESFARDYPISILVEPRRFRIW